MFDWESLIQFSHHYCVTICAVLVPCNLLVTLQTMIFTGLNRKKWQIRLLGIVSFLYAFLLLFHVFSWYIVGVVMAPTFILLFVGSLCTLINLWAIFYPESMQQFFQLLFRRFPLPQKLSWN